MDEFRRLWNHSKLYRTLLIIAGLWVLIRLGVHIAYLLIGDGSPGLYISEDLKAYLNAATHLIQGQRLYRAEEMERIYAYQYAPSYALAFVPFTWLSPVVLLTILSLGHFLSYVLLYQRWDHIFQHLKLSQAGSALAWSLPLWLIFQGFWANLAYYNIYVLMALLATLLIEAVLEERLGLAVLWLTLILQMKPQWAFAAILPLLLKQWRFFFKFIGLTILAYAGCTALTLVVVGPAYGWQEYQSYVQFMSHLTEIYPWRQLSQGTFLGYNHSIKQFVIYFLGTAPSIFTLANIIKILLLVPLAWVSLKWFFGKTKLEPTQKAYPKLAMIFAWYLATFIWLDVVWELTLALPVFAYLWPAFEKTHVRTWLLWLTILYAAMDIWQVLSFAIFGYDALAPGTAYVVTDPSLYFPLTMILILTYYTLLLRQLWPSATLTLNKTVNS
jgi:hypothetical protein